MVQSPDNLIGKFEMLNCASKKLVNDKLNYFEKEGFDLGEITEDSHFLSELTMLLMVMETEGKTTRKSFSELYFKVKNYTGDFVLSYCA
jgi:hypothetical protein